MKQSANPSPVPDAEDLRRWEALTADQKQLLEIADDGHRDNAAIAEVRGVGEDAVNGMLRRIREKLGTNNKWHSVREYKRLRDLYGESVHGFSGLEQMPESADEDLEDAIEIPPEFFADPVFAERLEREVFGSRLGVQRAKHPVRTQVALTLVLMLGFVVLLVLIAALALLTSVFLSGDVPS